MSSPHADDAFSIQFDDAVGKMHLHSHRGSKPSTGLWHDIRSQMHPEVNMSSATGNATSEQERSPRESVRTRGNPVGTELHHTSRIPRRSASTWIALALVVMLITSCLYLNHALQPELNDQQIAWAPGTTTTSPDDEIMVASPLASPTAIEYGPEFACTVEPLTADIVLDMVINPERELVRRGDTRDFHKLDKPDESGGNNLFWEPVFLDKEQHYGTNDPVVRQPITDTANQFWNCLMTGTAYQVWGLMYPSSVQQEILALYPVFLDEATLRAHIEKWGPLRYSASPHHHFPDLGGIEPMRASRVVDDSFGSVAVSSYVDANNPGSAVVIMVPHPDSGRSVLDHVKLLLHKAPDGSWWVVAIYYPDTPTGMGYSGFRIH